MRIGVLTTLFGSLPLEQALDRVTSHGLDAVELGGGGYAGTAHCDVSRVLADDRYRESLSELLRSRGLTLSALSVHGNPLHPNPEIASAHDTALRDGIRAAHALGIGRLNCFSGCPGEPNGGRTPNWITCPWPPDFGELWKWQWEEACIPYWSQIAELAAGHDVALGLEMHPGMIVYNPETLLRLRDATGPAVGANFDPSHLLWQGIDTVAAIRELGRHRAIHHVHAKDTRVDALNVSRNGNIDAKPYAQVLHRAWTFRTVGYGHGESFWMDVVSELRVAGYDHVLSIEHEDMLASVDEGLERAVSMLRRCVLTEPPAEAWWT